jgi:hypothetical protein
VGEQRTRYRYGPSRAFVYVVGVALAAQVVWALPASPVSSDTADLERVIFAELQTERPVSDVRCTRVTRTAATCIATLPDLGRLRVSARSDAAGWKLVDPLPEIPNAHAG